MPGGSVIIAVVQHRLRDSAEEDARALASAASRAAEGGAELIVFPEVPSLHEHPAREDLYAQLDPLEDRVPWIVPHAGPDCIGQSWSPEVLPGLEGLGSVALAVGDAVIDPAAIGRLALERPALLVAAPRSESDLQAEAVLELALGLSDSVTGLVIVIEPSGAEPGQPGHGGSAVAMYGEMVAEATEDEDVLLANVVVPVPQPEPRGPIPGVPPILLQRLAHHRGERVPVDYPADPS